MRAHLKISTICFYVNFFKQLQERYKYSCIFLLLSFFTIFLIFPVQNNFAETKYVNFLEKKNLASKFNKNKKIAVCYWGLTRSTKQVYKTHFQKIFKILKRHEIDYDVFMHTWRIKGKQKVWHYEIENPVDYNEYQLLKPTFYQIDDQDEFTNQLDLSNYFYKGIDDVSNTAWAPEIAEKLIFNHLCALESLKRVTEMVENSGNYYDFVIYLRPDVQFNNRLPISKILKLKNFDIIIPDFDHWAGYNDRFAVLNYNTAPIYGKRIEGLAEFRKTQGQISSEKYVKYICKANKLNVIFIPFHFDIIRPSS